MTASLLPSQRCAVLCAWCLAACVGLTGAAQAANSSREVISLDQDWRFQLGAPTNAIAPDCD